MHVAILHSPFWLPLQNWYCLIICILYALILTIGFVFVRLHCKINSMYKSPNRLTLWTDVHCTNLVLTRNHLCSSNGPFVRPHVQSYTATILTAWTGGSGGRGKGAIVFRSTQHAEETNRKFFNNVAADCQLQYFRLDN